MSDFDVRSEVTCTLRRRRPMVKKALPFISARYVYVTFLRDIRGKLHFTKAKADGRKYCAISELWRYIRSNLHFNNYIRTFLSTIGTLCVFPYFYVSFSWKTFWAYFQNFALFEPYVGRRLETFPSCWKLALLVTLGTQKRKKNHLVFELVFHRNIFSRSGMLRVLSTDLVFPFLILDYAIKEARGIMEEALMEFFLRAKIVMLIRTRKSHGNEGWRNPANH